MKTQKSIRGLIALLTVALVISTVSIPQYSFAQVAQDQTSGQVQIANEAQPAAIPDGSNPFAPPASKSVRYATGTTDPGAEISFNEYQDQSTISRAVGYQLYVEFDCVDNSNYDKYAGFIGLWDDVLGEYVQSYGTPTIVDSIESYYGIFDLSLLAAADDRYAVVAILYDTVTDETQAMEAVYLNVKALNKPTIVSVKPVNPHAVRIDFTVQSNGEMYKIYRATAEAGPYTYVGKQYGDDYNSTEHYDCTGLTTGKTYYFKVKSYCTGGATTLYSSTSTAKSGVPMPVAKTPKVTSASYNSLKISWSAATSANGYYIYRATSATGTYAYIGSTTSTSKTDTGLVTGKTYYYKVKAYHTESSGKRYYSAATTAVSGKPIPALPVTTGSMVSQNSIKVNWTGVTGAHGYVIYNVTNPYTEPMGMQKLATASSTARTYTLTNLRPNEHYDLVVVAYHTENGVNVYSFAYCQSVEFWTMGAPTVSAKMNAFGEPVVEWSRLVSVDKYELWRYDSSKPAEGYVLVLSTYGTTSDIQSYQDETAHPNATYTYRVRAYQTHDAKKIYCSFGYSSPFTPTLAAPTIDTFVAYDGSIDVTWKDVYDATNYIVERSTDGINFEQVGTVGNTYATYEHYYDSNFEAGQVYYYRVLAFYQTTTYSSPYSNIDEITKPVE